MTRIVLDTNVLVRVVASPHGPAAAAHFIRVVDDLELLEELRLLDTK
jgi:hypothetical protein